jgi:hypothetical protein
MGLPGCVVYESLDLGVLDHGVLGVLDHGVLGHGVLGHGPETSAS